MKRVALFIVEVVYFLFLCLVSSLNVAAQLTVADDWQRCIARCWKLIRLAPLSEVYAPEPGR